MPTDDYENYREPGDSFGYNEPYVEPKPSKIELIVAGTIGLAILRGVSYKVYKAVECFLNQ